MEYNIGDKVRINQQLTFKSYDIVKSMQMCYNKIAEIIDKQYDSFNNDFVEEHCGLEDTEIEKIIFWECLKMNSEIDCRLWS